MSSLSLQGWLNTRADRVLAPLFDADPAGRVRTHHVGRGGARRCLRRSAQMERAVIEVVEAGLEHPDWLGLVYMMGWGAAGRFRPLYIGKAGKAGRKPGVISANLRDLRTSKNKFARWGDGATAYHIGSLSTALFTDRSFNGRQKYTRWAEMLFTSTDPPTLRHPTSLMLIPWYSTAVGPGGATMSVEALEEALIDLALVEYDDVVLNVQGETWWAPAAARPRPREVLRPRNPVELVSAPRRLVELSAHLLGQPRLGLDVETEWRTQDLCVIQLATPSQTFVIDAVAMSDLAPLAPVMASPDVLKIIHNAAFERRVLRAADIELRAVYDTFRASERVSGRGKGWNKLSAVCERHLGLPMDKSEQRSRWERRPLSSAQLDYAALDAEIMLPLYDVLIAVDPQRDLFR